MVSCAFTGHRPKHFIFNQDEQHELCRKIKYNMLRVCRRLHDVKAVRTFYSGCAQGVDIWGAEAVLSLRESGYSDIRLCCAVPFPGHDKAWPVAEKKRLAGILSSADEIHTVANHYADDVYKRRNYFMIDNVQCLVAVYDRQNKTPSGTMQTVNYALKNDIFIVYINPANGEITI